MEQLENNTTDSIAEQGLYISKDARFYWPGTRAWMIFLGVASFLGAALTLFMIFTLYTLANSNFIAGSSQQKGIFLSILTYCLGFLAMVGIGVLFIWISNKISQASRFLHPKNIAQYTSGIRLYFILAGIMGILLVLIQIVSLMILTGG